MSLDSIMNGRFRVLKVIDRTGMSTVYQGLDVERERLVAIKSVPEFDCEDLGERLDREAWVLSRLDHPGVVDYIAHGETDDGQRCLVMEWLEGCDLKQRIARAPLSEIEVLALGRQVCAALGAIHRAGVLHRDIKPANLFLVNGELSRVKLIDFGLARDDARATQLSRTGALLGTPSYISPEQARGQRDIDARADLYSLGAVLFACLTQRTPFSGAHVMAMLAKLLLEPPMRVRELRPEISAGLDELIDQLLAKDPAERPESAEDVTARLDALERFGDCSEVIETRVHSAVTEAEQQYFSVLVVASDGAASSQQTLDWLAERYRGEPQRMVDGTILVVFSAGDDPGQMATQAARCALELHDAHGDAGMALATGRGLLGRRQPVGDVIDRVAEMICSHGDALNAARAVSPQRRPGIVIDHFTADLLEASFEHVRLEDGNHRLLGERAARRGARSLMGRDTRCVGRARELATLHSIFEECVDEPDRRAVLLLGEPGMGKSRVAHEFVNRLRAHAQKPAVWTATGDSMRSGTPLGMLAQLVRSGLGISMSDPVETRRLHIRERLSQRIPAAELERCVLFLGELAGTSFLDETSVHLREARRDARLMHDQMRQAWEDWLDAETRARPVLCILEDLHWGDLSTLRFVDGALRNLHERPFMVLALGRPDVLTTFPEMWAEREVEQIRLRPLTRKVCADIVHEYAPGDMSATAIDTLVNLCGGNPFYLEELIRNLASHEIDELPDTVLAMAAARLRALPAEERQVLRAASVFGHEFVTGGVEQLIQGPTIVVIEVLEGLCDREILVRRRSAQNSSEFEYSFRHELVREAAYAMLPAEDRARAHLRAGDWLELNGVPDAIVLAEHYRRADAVERAVPWFHSAAAQALEADDVTAVLAYSERAVACGAQGPTLGALRLLQAEAYNWKSEHEAARSHGLLAVELLPDGSEAWFNAANHVAWAAGELADFASVERITDRLLSDLPESPHIRHVIALAWCAAHLATGGQVRAANATRSLLDAVEPALANVPSVAATLAHVDGYLALVADKPDRAVRGSLVATAHWKRAGNQRNACLSRCNAAEILIMLGRYETAERTLRELLTDAERLEAAFLIDAARNFLALCLARQGRVSEAETLLRGDVSSRSTSHMRYVLRASLAEILLSSGGLPAALTETEALLPHVDRFPHTFARVQTTRARCLLSLDQPRPALDAAQEGMRILDNLGALEGGEVQLRLVYAEALDACGERDAARSAISRARQRVLAQAERIDNRVWRQDFLHRVEENRRTLERAQGL